MGLVVSAVNVDTLIIIGTTLLGSSAISCAVDEVIERNVSFSDVARDLSSLIALRSLSIM